MQEPNTDQSTGLHIDGDLQIDTRWQKYRNMEDKSFGQVLIRFADIGGTHTEKNSNTGKLIIGFQVLVDISGGETFQIAQQPQGQQKPRMISLGGIWFLVEDPCLEMILTQGNNMTGKFQSRSHAGMELRPMDDGLFVVFQIQADFYFVWHYATEIYFWDFYDIGNE